MFHTKQDVDRHVCGIFKNMSTESERNLKCFRIAKHYYAVNEYKSAIRYINRYLSENSNSAAAQKLLGECYLKLNLKVKALDSFKSSLELDGSQKDLLLKVCELLSDPEIPVDVARATYWLERTESLYPKDPVIFKLKEHLLKFGKNAQKNSAQLEKLILAEVTANPTDVTMRIRLLKFLFEMKRYQEAYEHAIEVEDRQAFSNNLRWYHCLCTVVEEYEKANENVIDRDLGFEFFIRKIIFLERRADLSMQEFQIDSKLTVDCSTPVFALDQALHAMSKLKVPDSEKEFVNEFLWHMGAQLCFHMATLIFKRAKKEYGIWPKAISSAAPLLFLACQNTSFLEDAWYNTWLGRHKHQIELWNKAVALRMSQAGHVLRGLARDKRNQFLQKVSQFCGGKWRTRVFTDVFINRKHQQATSTSFFLNHSAFANVVLHLLTEEELAPFDELSQETYPESLNHLVWLGLVAFKSNGQLSNNFRCRVLPDLQFSVDNLFNSGPETLNQLDVDAFLYASVLCAKSLIPNNMNSEKPSLLPFSISEDLCTPAQAEWWSAMYKTYRNKGTDDISEIRLKLRNGIEKVRVIGQHGLHVRLIVLLAKLFQERAKGSTGDEVASLEARSHLYWSAAIPLLEKLEKNQEIRTTPYRLFDYRGKELTPNEVRNYLEDGRLFLACNLMKQGLYEQAIEEFAILKSSYATYYQGLIYKQMASDVVNQQPESITSENRSQHVILLTRARDSLFLTLERLRNPGVDYDHPLNSQIHKHLEEIESQLARINTDGSSKNRNGDVETDESDAGPCLNYSDVDVYNNSGFLHDANVSRRSIRIKQNNSRSESKVSLERIDAHLRHLVEANKNELKEIKGSIEKGLINEVKLVRKEIKDLRVVFYDMLSEFRKWNRNENGTQYGRREAEPLDYGEDAENLSQFAGQYTNYHNYPNYHHIQTCQASSFSAPVVPQVSSVLQPGNIPTSIMPNTFFSSLRPLAPTDQHLFYQGLNFFPPGTTLPFADNQNVSSYRDSTPQKQSFMPNTSDVTTGTPVYPAKPTLSLPVIPVSTPSDTQPPSSVGVSAPNTQMKDLVPSSKSVTKSPSNQAHAFQIPMPPQAALSQTKPSPSENVWTNLQTPVKDSVYSGSSVITSSPSNTSAVLNASVKSDDSYVQAEPDTLPDFKPAIALPEEVKTIPIEANETKLFESRAKLLSFINKEWVERGVGTVNVLHNEATDKVRVVMMRDQVFKLCANHFILPEMELKPNKDERVLIWNAQDYSDGEVTTHTFGIRFSTIDEAKDFQFAFNKGKEIASKKKDNTTAPAATSTPNKSDMWVCNVCKKKYDGSVKECSACNDKSKDEMKMKFGGFTISNPTEFKVCTAKTEPPAEQQGEKTKPNPFASFAFKVSTPATGDSGAKPSMFNGGSQENNLSFAALATSAGNTNAFKKDENFKGFEGTGSLVFGYLQNKNKTNEKEKLDTSKGNEDDEEGGGHAGDFVPTAEFTPVIPLPDLIEVKTGEEDETVLYAGRAKLLRFASETKEWKERGIGDMKVLQNDKTGKIRLIMRREHVLKVCCNHFLDEKMKFEPMSKNEKAITWCAQDYSEGDLKAELFALRFGKPESMQAFKKVIEDCQKKMQNGRIIGTKVAEEQKDKSDAKPLSELFKPKPGSWECSSCYLRNDAERVRCVSCENPKDGTVGGGTGGGSDGKSVIKGLQLNPATGMGFTFGIPSTMSNQSVSTATPTTATTTTTTTTTKNIFSGFTSKPSEFTFGSPATSTPNTTDASKAFDSLKSKTFSFCVGSSGNEEKDKSVSDSNVSSSSENVKFSFGSQSPFTFGTSGTSIFGTPKSSDTPNVTVQVKSDQTKSPFSVMWPTMETGTGVDKNASVVSSSPAVDEVKGFVDDASDTKLFESRGKLSTMTNDKWVEQGTGTIKVLHNVKMNKVKILMRKDKIFKFIANHCIQPDTELKQSKTDEKSFVWNANDESDGENVARTFNIQFDTLDEAKDFRYAFEKGKELLSGSPGKKNDKVSKSETKHGEVWECPSCKKKYYNIKECATCKDKQKSTTFTLPSTKPMLFGPNSQSGSSQFGFDASALSFASLAASSTNAFKKDENFKGFEGTGSLVFGYLQNKNKTNEKDKLDTSKGNEDDEEGGGHAGDFVPTAEFTPVIPLPDLIEVKTGEEDETVLYAGRAKLLRFASETKEWKERGIGDMKVLQNDKTGKIRLIMRREHVLKVCCNHFLDEKMKFEPMSKNEKAITWCAQDYSEGDLKAELFALRFGKPESMQAFKKVIEDCQKKMQNGRIIGTKVAEEQKDKSDAKPLSELFKPKPGSWECSSCYLRNDAERVRCVSCENPKDGTVGGGTGGGSDGKSVIKGLQLNPAAGMGFTFGIPSTVSNQSIFTGTPTTATTTTAAATTTKNVFGGIMSKSSEPMKFSFNLPTPNFGASAPSTQGSSIFGSSKSPMLFSGFGDSANKNNAPATAKEGGEEQEDVYIVYEAKASNEEVENAKKLMLPPNFFLYVNARNCRGCRGCDDDDGSQTDEAAATPTPKINLFQTPTVGQAPVFGSWGSLKFDTESTEKKFNFKFGNANALPFGGTTEDKSNIFLNTGKQQHDEGDEDDEEEDGDDGDDNEYYDNDEDEDEDDVGEEEYTEDADEVNENEEYDEENVEEEEEEEDDDEKDNDE